MRKFIKLFHIYNEMSRHDYLKPKLIGKINANYAELMRLIDVKIEHPTANIFQLYSLYKAA